MEESLAESFPARAVSLWFHSCSKNLARFFAGVALFAVGLDQLKLVLFSLLCWSPSLSLSLSRFLTLQELFSSQFPFLTYYHSTRCDFDFCPFIYFLLFKFNNWHFYSSSETVASANVTEFSGNFFICPVVVCVNGNENTCIHVIIDNESYRFFWSCL